MTAALRAHIAALEAAEKSELAELRQRVDELFQQRNQLAIDRATYLALARYLAEELDRHRPVSPEILAVLS